MMTLHSNLTVRAVATERVSFIAPEATIELAFQQMKRDQVTELLIGNATELVGIVTANELVQSEAVQLPADFSEPLAKFFLRPVTTIAETATAEQARNLMRNHGISRLPIVADGRVIGLVRTIDLMVKFYGQVEQIRDSYALILDEIHEAVCVVDAKGTVLTWSKHASRMYNIANEDIINQRLDNFFPMALLTKVLETKKPIENIIHSPRPGAVVNISAVPLYRGDELVGAISTERDITEVRNLTSELHNTKQRLEFLQDEVSKSIRDNFTFNSVIGQSDQIGQIIRMAATVAANSSSILISGESGTGKEVIARAIHVASGRPGLFVPINCSAIPENLFESEMFGYVAGAFTGALSKGKVGKLELANNGTLFLDEIGDMPLSMQAKLLRFLQDKEVTRIGDNQAIKVNLRVICATNRDLEKMVANQTFREDLFYRLNVVALDMPPLRERAQDIPLFVKHFLQEICHSYNKPAYPIDRVVMDKLMHYDWPGNIRELRNVIEQMVIFAKDRLTVDLLPTRIWQDTATVTTDAKLQTQADQVERAMLQRALDKTNGNKSLAAELLGITRPTLYYKLKKHQLLSNN